MAKRPGPKGKKSKNRMTGAEVEAANAEHAQKQAGEQAGNVQASSEDVEQETAAIDQPFTMPEEAQRDAVEPTEDREQTEGQLDDPPVHAEQVPEGDAEPKVEGDAEEDKVPNSVVKDKFKKKYIEQAKAAGVTGKAAKRSNWDWLAQTIAEQCLIEKEKIDIGRFTDLLDANGVDHSRWTNRNKGWEGRFRMTGRVALQKIVATNGVLKTMTGEVVPPAEWIAKYKPKV